MKKTVSVLLIPVAAMLLLTGSIALVLVLAKPFYALHIAPLDLAAAVELDTDAVKLAFSQVMDYCMGLRQSFAAGVLPFSQSGADHFADVQKLFLLDFRVLAVCVVLLVPLLWIGKKQGGLCRFGGHGSAFWGAVALLAVFVCIALYCVSDFDRAFVTFHTVFFPGRDNWLFDWRTDPVILMLPEVFFRNCAIAIFAVLAVSCGVIVGLDRKKARRSQKADDGV